MKKSARLRKPIQMERLYSLYAKRKPLSVIARLLGMRLEAVEHETRHVPFAYDFKLSPTAPAFARARAIGRREEFINLCNYPAEYAEIMHRKTYWEKDTIL